MKWLTLHPKIQTAVATVLGLDSATLIAWTNGTVTWKEAVAAIVAIDLPVLVGYLTPSSKAPNVA